MDIVQYVFYYNSPLGEMMMASDGYALEGLWFLGQKYFAASITDNIVKNELPIFQQTVRWLDCYFGGKAPQFTPLLSMRATIFRKTVWEILLTIPFGRTMTYGEIAKIIAGQTGESKMSAQAVGGAVSHNPISIIIPCHRVVGANGNLTGYAGGIDKKAQLLAIEGKDMSKFYMPT